MFQKSVILTALFLISVLCSAQCSNRITLVPLHVLKTPKRSRDFVRFSYPLTATDSLIVYARDDPDRSLRPYDTGIAITRGGKALQRVALRSLPEMRREDEFFRENFTTLAIARACAGDAPLYFVAMGYVGDMTSADLFFSVVPNPQDYVVSALPMVAGGVLDVSKANPLNIRTWDNLFEGECNACGTHYRIAEYQIQEGKPFRIRRYRTKHLYSSDDRIFDDRRRIRFIP
jgi:hypothetical protein